MSEITNECPRCGSDAANGGRSFVHYVPEPNDAQSEMEWTNDLQELRGFVCTECGYILGVVDLQDPERDEWEETRTKSFKVDEPLE
jgi:DNA-directed RNA polymerase subunit RPC12/RpoP